MTENLRRGRSAKKVIVNTEIEDPSSNVNVEELLDKFLNYQKTVEEAIEKIKKENINLAKNVYIKIESLYSEVNKKLQFFESNLSQFQSLVQIQSHCQPQFEQPLLPLLQTQLQPNPQPQLQPILQPQLQPLSQPHLLPIPQSQPQSIPQSQIQPMLQSQIQPMPQSQIQPMPQSQIEPMPQSQFQSITQSSQIDFTQTTFNQNLQNIISEKLNLTNIDSWIFSIETFLSSSNFSFMLNRRPINDQEIYLDKYIFNILFFNIEESFRQKIILRSDYVFDLLHIIKNFNQPHINNFREDIISQLTSLCFQTNELHKFNSKFLNIVNKHSGVYHYLNEQFLIGIYLNSIKSNSYIYSQVSDYVNSNPVNILTLKQVMRIALRYGKQCVNNFNRNFNSNYSSFFNDTSKKKAISKTKRNKNIKDLKTKNFFKQNDNVIHKKYQNSKNITNNTESTLNFTKNSLKAFNINIKPKTKSSSFKSINSTIQLDDLNNIDIKPKIQKFTSSSSKQNNQVSNVFNEIDIKPDIKSLETKISQENVSSAIG